MYQIAKNRYETLDQWLSELKEFQLDSIFETSILGRAFLYTDIINITTKKDNLIVLKVHSKSMYSVQLSSIDHTILCTCSCPYEGKCKHMAAALLVLINR